MGISWLILEMNCFFNFDADSSYLLILNVYYFSLVYVLFCLLSLLRGSIGEIRVFIDYFGYETEYPCFANIKVETFIVSDIKPLRLSAFVF